MNQQVICKNIADAICKKNIHEVQRFISEGISPNDETTYYNKPVLPLTLCTQNYDENIARLLLQNLSDLNAPFSEDGDAIPANNYMETAIRYQNTSMIKLLLEFNFDLTTQFRENYSYIYSLVHTLSFSKPHEEVMELLNQFIAQDAPIGIEELRQIPYCCQSGTPQQNKTLSELLITTCKDINETDMQGCTILHVYLRDYTTSHDRSGKATPKTENIRDILLDILLTQTDIDVTLRNYNDESPLYLACIFGPAWTVQKLLQMGADVFEICTSKNISTIHAAAKNPEKMASLIEFGADINAPDEDGNNLLHLACGVIKEYKNNEMRPAQTLNTIPFMLNNGIDVNKANNSGNSPFHYLVLVSTPEVIKTIDLLLEHGADINSLNEALQTPFFVSAISYDGQFRNKTQPVLKHLLSRGAMIDMQDTNGRTPLYFVVKNEDAMMVRFLLDNGADPSVTDNDGDSPYKLALQKNMRAILSMIEKATINIELDGDDMDAAFLKACKGGKRGVAEMLVKRGNIDITYVDDDGRSALHYASELGMISLVKFLTEQGADLNYTDKWGQTALHFAASARQREMVRYLLEQGADSTIPDNKGVLPIHLVTNRGQHDLLKLLLEHGSDPFVMSNDGESLLMVACYTRSRESVRLLLEAGLDVNISDNDGITPLQVAVRNNQSDMVNLLNEYNVDVLATNSAGAQAIHIAASKGFKEMVRLLVKLGAPIDAKNDTDMTPLHLAAMSANKDMFKCLCEMGADLEAKTSDGDSCMDIATNNGQKEIIEILAIMKKRREILGN